MTRAYSLLACAVAALLAVAVAPTHTAGGNTYRAAAIQFTPSGQWNTPPEQIVQQSVDRFEPFVAQATHQGAQLVLFPEGGTGMFFGEIVNTRDSMLPYCVEIGDVDQAPNPCAQPQPDPASPFYQTWRVSCLANKYGVIVIMNLCEKRACTSATDPACPTDGRYQWNTQVVFNETGTIVLKYHKSHLFGGGNVFDQAAPVSTSFVSSFGVRFGTFICFDMMYPHPAADLVQEGVTDFLFSSYWVNSAPSTNALVQQQAWSRLHQVNLIASNVGSNPGNSGGGIFASGEVLASLFDPDTMAINQMLIADLPIHSKKRRSVPSVRPAATPAFRTVTPPLTSLSYEQCQINVVMQGLANCTAFTAATLREAAIAEGIDVDALKSTSFTIPVSSGGVSCTVEIAFAQVDPANQFIVAAFEGVEVFPYTPSPLSLQSCVLQHCVAGGRVRPGRVHPSDLLACRGSWDLFATTFSSFSITATGFDADTAAFPMLAVDNGQVAASQLGDFVDHNPERAKRKRGHKHTPSNRVLNWSSTPVFVNQSLSTALIYGVRPNP